MPLDEIEDIISHNQDVIVIVDEAYVDFGGHSAQELLSKYENLLVVQTFSKSRSMAGMRIGYAMGSAELIKALNDVKYSFNSYTMNRTSLWEVVSTNLLCTVTSTNLALTKFCLCIMCFRLL